MKLENLELKRLTVHKIYGRSKTNDAPFASECKELTKLGSDGMETLHKRVNSCINHKSKFYELDLSDKSEGSFFEIHKSLSGAWALIRKWDSSEDAWNLWITTPKGKQLTEWVNEMRVPKTQTGPIIIEEPIY